MKRQSVSVSQSQELSSKVLPSSLLLFQIIDKSNHCRRKLKLSCNKTEEKEHVRKSRKKYQDMKVIELKMKVNNLKLDYTWNQIKGMTKKKLIEILIKNNQEE